MHAPHLLHESALNAAGLKQYFEDYGSVFKDPIDMICCLPTEFRKNYVIAHTSNAGQSSDVRGSRVILYNELQKRLPNGKLLEKPLKALFSINGGAAHLSNGDNVEVMIDNPTRREVELFDAEVIGKAHLSGKNPAACIQCHGNDGRVDVGGPKTIFEPFVQWTRFIKGSNTCNAVEKQYVRALEVTAKETMRANRRYRCLDRKPAGQDPFEKDGINPSFSLAALDNELELLNDRRVASLIRRTPEFDTYKYVIVGARLCQATCVPSEWMPAERLAAHDAKVGLLPHVATSENLLETIRAEFKRMKAEDVQIEQHQAQAIKRLEKGETPHFKFSTNPTACVSQDQLGSRISLVAGEVKGTSGIERYRADAILRSVRNSPSMNPELRFLF